MDAPTLCGAGAVTLMMVTHAMERRANWWRLVFALARGASSVYGWLAGTWPVDMIEGVWAIPAARGWWPHTVGVTAR
jgi:hypothetical protein